MGLYNENVVWLRFLSWSFSILVNFLFLLIVEQIFGDLVFQFVLFGVFSEDVFLIKMNKN
jgi:hypothetical protein